jgi:hypothetical protein
MLPLSNHPKLYDQPVSLTKEEIKTPGQVLKKFFEDYRLSELRFILWEMVETCLTTENTQFSDAEDRANLLHQYKDLERLLEATSIIINNQHPGKDDKSSALKVSFVSGKTPE